VVEGVVVLAAGEGTRMRSTTPKVLHVAAGRTLLASALAATAALEPEQTIVVVGAGRDAVVAHLGELAPDAQTVVQEHQRGTGHATRVALDALPDLTGRVLVTYGDMPLLTPGTLAALAGAADGAGAALLTARLADPTGYGRVVRGVGGDVAAIVEHKDATDEQRAIDEVNAGVYVFDVALLRACLQRLSTDNAQGEEYLTDVVGILVADGHQVRAVVAVDPLDVLGVNDRSQLAQAAAVLRRRHLDAAMRAGATVVDPATTVVDLDVVLEPDCVVEPFCVLRGATSVAAGAVVGPYADLTDTTVGAGARVRAATCVGAEIGPDADVGPWTYLRPGTRLARGAKAGAYVEMKNAEVGEDSKVPHLSYVGDATIGRRSNIGAGTIFVNYDGVAKHVTTVGDDVRVGSDNCLVAPVTIEDTAYTAAGSVITKDVPAGALGVGRAQQRNIDGWVARKRPRSDQPSADQPSADQPSPDQPSPDQQQGDGS
jgi:bifunctional UDP-N-acetylglucosamine pyrophosphorylase / glucosamine-1-phosphate N-acetyltransferase